VVFSDDGIEFMGGHGSSGGVSEKELDVLDLSVAGEASSGVMVVASDFGIATATDAGGGFRFIGHGGSFLFLRV